MPCFPTELYSLSGSVSAANFSAPPTLKLVAGNTAFQKFDVTYEILGITLSSTLTNFGAAIMGVFVVVGPNQPTITFATSTPALIHAITGQNSITGPPALPVPSDKVASKVYLQPILVPPGKQISLYAFGDTTAGNFLQAFVSLDMRRKH